MLWFFIRFVLFAAVYVGIVLWWADSEGGHGAMGIVAGGIILAAGAALSWLGAMIIGRYVRNVGVRFAVHVLSVVLIFPAFAALSLPLAGTHVSLLDSAVSPFMGIVAIAAMADGAVGLWREQRKITTNG